MLRYLRRYRGRHGVSVSVTSRYLHVGGVEFSFQDSALTGGPRSPVVAWETGPSHSSSDAFSTVAFPETVLSRLRCIRTWKRGGAGIGGWCQTVV